MHLTNYSINKFSENFTVDEKEFKTGSKRTISSVMERIREMGYDVDQLWKEIAVSSTCEGRYSGRGMQNTAWYNCFCIFSLL